MLSVMGPSSILTPETENIGQHLRFFKLLHRQEAKAQTSLLRVCAVSPEPSLFAYTKYRNRN